MQCIFISDLHGQIQKYKKLFQYIEEKKPDAVFFGGDLLPMIPSNGKDMETFIETIILKPIKKIKEQKKEINFFVILGNDDPKRYEPIFKKANNDHIISYVHQKTIAFKDLFVTGYAFVPPTPFQLKDWERYDVSRFVDVGTISPEEGQRSVPAEKEKIRFETIKKDLDTLVKNAPPDKTIFLFHSPPYDTFLDRAALDGKKVDHTPLDVHIGSIAIKRFINTFQPFITLHGHVHESSQITGEWRQTFDRTVSFSAAYNGEKLAIINFDTNNPQEAERKVLEL
jgi:Icc-related predicted phosphoesterase